MAVLALDIGTTKICAIAIDEESGAVLDTRYADNAFLPSVHAWERTQDPERIFSAVDELVSSMTKKHRAFRCIGVTGQMHGILYVDSSGRAISPLYTWQDTRASQITEKGETYAARLAEFSFGRVAPGYGTATWFYHHLKKEVPRGAVKICTIGDYAAMRLSSSSLPVMHATNAGGIGFFDLHSLSFDEANLEAAGLDPSLLPPVVSGAEIIGEYLGGVPVSAAIGDNQAGFLGSVEDSGNSILVNMGTGSQISFAVSCAEDFDALEVRPFFEGRFLLVGASLCGGRAYAILESFFRQVLEMAGLDSTLPLYRAMDRLAEKSGDTSLTVNTLFAGTRSNPSVRGSILNISEDNFTPARLIAGFLRGAAAELYDFYSLYTSHRPRENGEGRRGRLIGAGNGIRRSGPLRRVLQEAFGMPLEIPLYKEEAAYGAALFALSSAGYFKNVFESQRLVKYE